MQSELMFTDETGSLLHYFLFNKSFLQNSLKDSCNDNSSYCRGARAGADQVVKDYEKQCLENTPDECIGLGEAAAEGKIPQHCTLFYIFIRNILIVLSPLLCFQKLLLGTALFRPHRLHLSHSLITRRLVAKLHMVFVKVLLANKSMTMVAIYLTTTS